MQSVALNDNITVISDYAFFYCNKLKTITVPSSVKEIGEFAFANCTSLVSIEIPKALTIIEDSAFRNCNALETVVYHGTAESWANIQIGKYNEKINSAKKEDN